MSCFGEAGEGREVSGMMGGKKENGGEGCEN